MLASLLYSIVRLLVDILSVRDREQAELQAEVLVLRHQLRVLERQVRRPRWSPGDRMILATIIERLPKRRWSALHPEVASRARAPQVGRVRQAFASVAAGD
jgi:putative transposase